MSAAYEFRKIYVDCVTDRGQVAVLYLNWVRLAGAWIARRSVEVYEPDGSRTVVDLPPPDGSAWDGPLPEGVTLTEVHGAWEPPPSPIGPVLSWSVAHARARVALTWPGGGLEGVGYADRVRITRPTRVLGLSTLAWGRAHLPDRTVVFEDLATVDGARWMVGVDWRVGEETPRPLAGPMVLAEDGHARVPLADGALELSPTRVLHQGDAFDPERVPRAMDRWFCRTLGGPTFETRWLGEALLGGLRAPALYERVRFGG